MSFFQKLSEFFSNLFNKQKKQDEWAARFGGPTADSKDKLPLDPKAPWNT